MREIPEVIWKDYSNIISRDKRKQIKINTYIYIHL